MAMYLTLIISQIFLCYCFGRILIARGLGIYLIFYLIFLILIAIPFFLIAADSNQLIDLAQLFGKSTDARVTLDLGNGLKPLTISILFQALYLMGGYLNAWRAGPKTYINEPKSVLISAEHMLRFSLLLAFVSIGYMLVRYYFVPDFPLFQLIASIDSDAPLRDISYNYIIRTDIPYLFRASVQSQFYRIGLPLSTLIFAHTLNCYPELRTPKLMTLLGILVAITVILSLGTFKRSPILYLLVWSISYFYMYANSRKLINITVVFAAAMMMVSVITFFYGYENFLVAFKILLRRLLVVEALGEFLALEHFGRTFNYLGFDIGQRYLDKLLGHEVQTFSEYWKIATGGTRGFTSIGVMSELYASLSYAALPFYLLIGYLLHSIDLKMFQYRNSAYRPFIAGLMCVVGFMSVKGFFSQLFTGGTLTILLALTVYKLTRGINFKNGFSISR